LRLGTIAAAASAFNVLFVVIAAPLVALAQSGAQALIP
jgi:hypothetical protein